MVSTVSPLFPGNLFVRLDNVDQQQWRSINGMTGVLRMVSFGAAGRPAPLPAGPIERLYELSDSEGAVRLRDQVAAGDRVRLVGGPCDDLCGRLETAKDNERVAVLLDLLSKQTRVHVRRDLLIAA